jgi:NAD(P)-dependent dehydrogenase (short-subunit alcohol dehydrogenase family)
VKLENQIAIVTGGAQGIGRAIALGLAREGANVVIADIQVERAEATVDEIWGMGRQAIALRTDVSNLSDIAVMMDAALEAFGTLDILVNNAGIALRTPFFETTEDTWQRIIDVNLKSVFFCSQYAARVMMEKRAGKIVSVSSTSGFVAGREEVPYAIAKAGVRMLTSALAAELASYNINVNAIAPGLIRTGLTERLFASEEALLARARQKTPMGRPGTPDDLVGGVVFLCSRDADFVTGHTLVIDGGWLTQ